MTKYRYSSEWIHELEEQVHWQFYWHQQKLLNGRLDDEDRIAEIGVGSGFTYNYLKSKGYHIVSIDIDAGKTPDIIANIVDCEDEILHYDVILGFNIFEHMPYDEFLSVAGKLYRTGVKKIFVALPSNRKIVFELKINVGRWLNIHKMITKLRNRITTPTHHWELDYNKHIPQKIKDDMLKQGYVCNDFFRFRRQSYFYFQRELKPDE